jgi:hypothetical protein
MKRWALDIPVIKKGFYYQLQITLRIMGNVLKIDVGIEGNT